MKFIRLAVILIFAFNLVDAKKQAEWFLAETTEDCENIPSELRSDNPVGLCEKVSKAILVYNKGFHNDSEDVNCSSLMSNPSLKV